MKIVDHNFGAYPSKGVFTMIHDDSRVDEAFAKVLDRMKRAGFKINQEVKVKIDDDLPFMGYTSRRTQSHVIVVSGYAVKSSMLEGLLTHELSHVYRTITNHPSHNESLISGLMRLIVDSHRLGKNYEQETLHQVINHIQDLYADDIAIKILTANPSMRTGLEQLGEFFLDWIRENPPRRALRPRDRWINASILLNNCFALSNMERHGMPESQIEKGKAINDRFMKQIKPNAAKWFDDFNKFMTSLEEEVSESQFQEEMKNYLHGFLETVDNI